MFFFYLGGKKVQIFALTFAEASSSSELRVIISAISTATDLQR